MNAPAWIAVYLMAGFIISVILEAWFWNPSNDSDASSVFFFILSWPILLIVCIGWLCGLSAIRCARKIRNLR